jgi:hypothetical protein
MIKKHPKDMDDYELVAYMDELIPLLEKFSVMMSFPDWECHMAIVLKISGRPARNVKVEFDVDPKAFLMDGGILVVDLFDKLIWIDDNKLEGYKDPLLGRMKVELVRMKEFYTTEEFVKRGSTVMTQFINFMRNVRKKDI